VAELVARLRSGARTLCDDVVEAITTNETSFFRDVHPFDALREAILPELTTGTTRSLRIWSAAASTGQEPYSVAMLLREHFPNVPDASILATDLSRDVLAKAASGRFTQAEVNRGLPARLLVKHFDRDGLEWQVKERVRRMVEFRQLNLARPLPPLPTMDVVLLRNVLIYFDAATKASVLRQMARVLHPGGYLFLGSAETTYGLDAQWERVAVGRCVLYRLARKEPV
jgi:chemotaxis protein methyltransferase CheR